MVQTEFTVQDSQRDAKLVDLIAQALVISKKRAKALLDSRAVLVNDRRVWMAAHKLRVGDRVHVTNSDLKSGAVAAKPQQLKVLFQDSDYVIVDKPAGRLSDGSDSIESDLRSKMPGVLAVHRLDRDTSGCLIFAKHEKARTAAEVQFREQKVKKIYVALIVGHLPRSRLTIDTPIGGRSAVTHCVERQRGPGHSQIEVTIETGRTHQIRKHLQSIGRAVLGDRVYAGRAELSAVERAVARQMLHAWRIEFGSPSGKRQIVAQAPWPADFQQCFGQLIGQERSRKLT